MTILFSCFHPPSKIHFRPECTCAMDISGTATAGPPGRAIHNLRRPSMRGGYTVRRDVRCAGEHVLKAKHPLTPGPAKQRNGDKARAARMANIEKCKAEGEMTRQERETRMAQYRELREFLHDDERYATGLCIYSSSKAPITCPSSRGPNPRHPQLPETQRLRWRLFMSCSQPIHPIRLRAACP
jgi:hypothetical protein